MAKILVIPDVHLKHWIFDKAEAIDKSDYDTIVCLGDLVDEWFQQNNRELYEETIEKAINFGISHKNSFWCYGNHDLSYLHFLQESGFSLHMMSTVENGMKEMKKYLDDRLNVMHYIDGWLFSHAGLTEYFISKHLGGETNLQKIITETNKMAYDHDLMKKHLWTDSSPIWFRFQSIDSPILETAKIESKFCLYHNTDKDPIWQCVGHTPTARPWEYTPYALSLDTFSLWSNGDPIGNQRLVIIDTDTNSWRYTDSDTIHDLTKFI